MKEIERGGKELHDDFEIISKTNKNKLVQGHWSQENTKHFEDGMMMVSICLTLSIDSSPFLSSKSREEMQEGNKIGTSAPIITTL